MTFLPPGPLQKLLTVPRPLLGPSIRPLAGGTEAGSNTRPCQASGKAWPWRESMRREFSRSKYECRPSGRAAARRAQSSSRSGPARPQHAHSPPEPCLLLIGGGCGTLGKRRVDGRDSDVRLRRHSASLSAAAAGAAASSSRSAARAANGRWAGSELHHSPRQSATSLAALPPPTPPPSPPSPPRLIWLLERPKSTLLPRRLPLPAAPPPSKLAPRKLWLTLTRLQLPLLRTRRSRPPAAAGPAGLGRVP